MDHSYYISVCRLRERGRMSKSVYVHVFHDLESLRERGRMSKSVYVRVFHDLESSRYVLRCAIERQL